MELRYIRICTMDYILLHIDNMAAVQRMSPDMLNLKIFNSCYINSIKPIIGICTYMP